MTASDVQDLASARMELLLQAAAAAVQAAVLPQVDAHLADASPATGIVQQMQQVTRRCYEHCTSRRNCFTSAARLRLHAQRSGRSHAASTLPRAALALCRVDHMLLVQAHALHRPAT